MAFSDQELEDAQRQMDDNRRWHSGETEERQRIFRQLVGGIKTARVSMDRLRMAACLLSGRVSDEKAFAWIKGHPALSTEVEECTDGQDCESDVADDPGAGSSGPGAPG